MGPSTVMDLAYRGMETILLLSIPLLGTALLTGLLVALFQAATQINEQTLSFIPKIFAVLLVLMLAGPWFLGILQTFTVELFTQLPSMLH